jgi:hypothetical protein
MANPYPSNSGYGGNRETNERTSEPTRKGGMYQTDLGALAKFRKVGVSVVRRRGITGLPVDDFREILYWGRKGLLKPIQKITVWLKSEEKKSNRHPTQRPTYIYDYFGYQRYHDCLQQ